MRREDKNNKLNNNKNHLHSRLEKQQDETNKLLQDLRDTEKN
ncbi:MAG: hypothetical protein ACRC1M_07495 [Methanobacteriaceae archaeon]